MAVNDFWRRLSRDLSAAEETADRYITPTLFETALLDLSAGSGITQPQLRNHFGLAVGTDAGTEFGDLFTSLQSLPGTAGLGGTRLALQERVLRRIISVARLGSWPGLAANPYRTGEQLRVRAKELIAAFGGTPTGTLAV